ncbi:MAG TPA: methyltransferase, partial [Clostridiales bacterium]|nr:methyltransferase [Clostridiales bacterium]
MKRNMRAWMFSVANSPERKAVPVLSFPGITLLGVNVVDLVSDGRVQYESMQAIANRYSTAAAVSMMDLSVEAEAFGSPVNFSNEEVPTVKARIIAGKEDAEALKVPEVGDGRTGEYIRAISLAARNIVDRPVFAGMIGPFSLSGRLMDMTEIMVASITEPELVHTVLEKTTSFLIGYANAYKQAGANGLIIAEPAAGLLSPEMCDAFSSVYVRRIVEAVQDDSFMVILHNCGNTVPLVRSMLSTGAMGYHFGNAVDMADIMPQIPWGVLAMGNIDPARVFKNGTVQDVREKTHELLVKTANYKNFVLSSGCDIPPL